MGKRNENVIAGKRMPMPSADLSESEGANQEIKKTNRKKPFYRKGLFSYAYKLLFYGYYFRKIDSIGKRTDPAEYLKQRLSIPPTVRQVKEDILRQPQ